MIICFKYRIYPNEQQEILIQKTFSCCRFIYNQMLSERISVYENLKDNKEVLRSYKYKTEKEYKQEFEWLKEVDSISLQQSRIHLQNAYKNFFKNPKTGFPKFKSKKNDKKSYTSNNVNNSIKIVSQNHIKIPKLGNVKFVEHRRIPKENIIKSATISQSASGKYYVSILTEYEYEIPNYQIDTTKPVGLDYSTPEFYVDSQGNKPLGFEKLYRKSEKDLAREQRKLSRMKLHSANYEKQKLKIARIHEKIANQRKDFIEKESTRLASLYDVVCVEDINLQNQSQSLNLGKSTMDNGFGMFRIRLQQKLEIQGKKFVKIDKWQPTSTVCSNCGTYHKDIVNSLSVREWTCPDCGANHNRDENAAKNILNAGLLLV